MQFLSKLIQREFSHYVFLNTAFPVRTKAPAKGTFQRASVMLRLLQRLQEMGSRLRLLGTSVLPAGRRSEGSPGKAGARAEERGCQELTRLPAALPEALPASNRAPRAGTHCWLKPPPTPHPPASSCTRVLRP